MNSKKIALVLGIFLILICLLPGLRMIDTNIPPGLIIGNYPKHLDFSTWHKSVLTKCLGLCLLGLIIFKIKQEYKFILKENKFIFILSTLTMTHLIVSTLWSEYFYYSFFGFFDQHQGMLVEISYLLLLTYLGINKYDKIWVKISIFILVMTLIISIFQYYGHFFLKYKILTQFFPGSEIFPSFIPVFGDGAVTASFGNTNYMGGFLSVFFPITFFLYVIQEKGPYKIFLFILSCTSFYVLILSASRAGSLGCAVSLVLLLSLFFKKFLSRWKSILIIFAAFFLVILSQRNILKTRLNVSQSEIKISSNVATANKYETYSNKNTFFYSVNGEGVKIVFDKEKGQFDYENEKGAALNLSNSPISLTSTGKSIALRILKTGRLILAEQTFANNKLFIFKDESTSEPLLFQIVNNEVKMLHPSMYTHFDNTPAKAYFPTRFDRLFSYRMYIWSRTLPLVVKHPFLGNGLQTFAIFFPNNDLQGRLNVGLDMKTFFDKPHSWYMQLLYDLGFVGFILYISIILYVSKTLVYVYKYKQALSESMLYYICFMSGVISYCVTHVFSDSWNGMTIFFWFFLGLALALKKEILENKK